MTRQSQMHTEERRTFLKKLAAAGGATAAVAISGHAAASSPEPGPASESTRNQGYHETPHIRHYYRTAKL